MSITQPECGFVALRIQHAIMDTYGYICTI